MADPYYPLPACAEDLGQGRFRCRRFGWIAGRGDPTAPLHCACPRDEPIAMAPASPPPEPVVLELRRLQAEDRSLFPPAVIEARLAVCRGNACGNWSAEGCLYFPHPCSRRRRTVERLLCSAAGCKHWPERTNR